MREAGAGQTTKFIKQLLCAINFQAVAKAERLAEAGKVDASRLSTALAGVRADPARVRAQNGHARLHDHRPYPTTC